MTYAKGSLISKYTNYKTEFLNIITLMIKFEEKDSALKFRCQEL